MNAKLIAVGILGVVLGLVGGALLFGNPGDGPLPENPALRSRIAELEAELDRRPPPVVPGAKDETPQPEVKTTPAADPTPKALEARVRELAEAYRTRGQRTIDNAEVVARLQVAREVAKERAQREDLARGGTMAWLRSLKKDWNPPWELLSDPEKYGALFGRKTSGLVVDGLTVGSDTKLSDGDRIVFPEGKHALDIRPLNKIAPFPKDILIEGAGMDRTLVRLNDEVRFRGDIHSLTFRDLTIHCGDNYLEAMSDGPYTLRVERCRIIGFDMGAGGSNMLSGSVGAFYATDSKIEAGFGRSPGFGNLFDVRGALVVRLENCDIVGPFRSIYYQWSGAAHHFSRCRLTKMVPSARSTLEGKPPQLRLEECSIEYLPEGADDTPEKRKLSELNPTW